MWTRPKDTEGGFCEGTPPRSNGTMGTPKRIVVMEKMVNERLGRVSPVTLKGEEGTVCGDRPGAGPAGGECTSAATTPCWLGKDRQAWKPPRERLVENTTSTGDQAGHVLTGPFCTKVWRTDSLNHVTDLSTLSRV